MYIYLLTFPVRYRYRPAALQKNGFCKSSQKNVPLHSTLKKEWLAVGLIVRGGFERPDVRAHGGFATGCVLLRIEGCEISRLLGRVFQTRANRCRDGCELTPMCYLVSRYRCGTGHGVESAEVHTIALADLGRGCGTVGSQNHFLVYRVRRFLVDLGQRAAQGAD